MDRYHIALFVHIIAVMVAAGATAVSKLAVGRRARAKTVGEALDWHNVLAAASGVFPLCLAAFVLTGFYMLLLLVGLKGISAETYEAAEIDGAGRWQMFRHITLPLLRPSLALATILCVTGSLLAFDQFYILTKGGPDNSTITVVQLIYIAAFQGRNDLGVAAALSIIVLLALLVLNFALFRNMRSPEEG